MTRNGMLRKWLKLFNPEKTGRGLLFSAAGYAEDLDGAAAAVRQNDLATPPVTPPDSRSACTIAVAEVEVEVVSSAAAETSLPEIIATSDGLTERRVAAAPIEPAAVNVTASVAESVPSPVSPAAAETSFPEIIAAPDGLTERRVAAAPIEPAAVNVTASVAESVPSPGAGNDVPVEAGTSRMSDLAGVTSPLQEDQSVLPPDITISDEADADRAADQIEQNEFEDWGALRAVQEVEEAVAAPSEAEVVPRDVRNDTPSAVVSYAMAGGTLTVTNGQTITITNADSYDAIVVQAGGILNISGTSGNIASFANATVEAGGTIYLKANSKLDGFSGYGTDPNTVVLSLDSATAVLTNATLYSGRIYLGGAATISNITLAGNGVRAGTAIAQTRGIIQTITVENGSWLTVSAAGTANEVTVRGSKSDPEKDAYQGRLVVNGGTVNGATIEVGGVLEMYANNHISDLTIDGGVVKMNGDAWFDGITQLSGIFRTGLGAAPSATVTIAHLEFIELATNPVHLTNTAGATLVIHDYLYQNFRVSMNIIDDGIMTLDNAGVFRLTGTVINSSIGTFVLNNTGSFSCFSSNIDTPDSKYSSFVNDKKGSITLNNTGAGTLDFDSIRNEADGELIINNQNQATLRGRLVEVSGLGLRTVAVLNSGSGATRIDNGAANNTGSVMTLKGGIHATEKATGKIELKNFGTMSVVSYGVDGDGKLVLDDLRAGIVNLGLGNIIITNDGSFDTSRIRNDGASGIAITNSKTFDIKARWMDATVSGYAGFDWANAGFSSQEEWEYYFLGGEERAGLVDYLKDNYLAISNIGLKSDGDGANVKIVNTAGATMTMNGAIASISNNDITISNAGNMVIGNQTTYQKTALYNDYSGHIYLGGLNETYGTYTIYGGIINNSDNGSIQIGGLIYDSATKKVTPGVYNQSFISGDIRNNGNGDILIGLASGSRVFATIEALGSGAVVIDMQDGAITYGETSGTNITITGGIFYGTIFGKDATNSGGTVINVSNNQVDMIVGSKNSLTLGTDITLRNETVNNSIFVGAIFIGAGEYFNIAQVAKLKSFGSVLNSVIYGGNYGGGSVGGVELQFNADQITRNVYGGGKDSTVQGNVVLEFSGVTLDGQIYAGGDGATVGGDIDLTIKSGTVMTGNLYGGGDRGNVAGTVNIDVAAATIHGMIIGGALTAGNAVGGVALTIADAADIRKMIYGGGYGSVGTAENTAATIAIQATITGGSIYALVSGAISTSATVSTSVYGNIQTDISGGTFQRAAASIFLTGGSRVAAAKVSENVVHTVTGSIKMHISGTAVFADALNLYAAGYVTCATANIADRLQADYVVKGGVTLNWSAANFRNPTNGYGIFLGAFAASRSYALVEGDAVAKFDIGDYNIGNVHGGGWAQTGGKTEIGDVSITVRGGTFHYIMGGGISCEQNGSTKTGAVSITIDGGSVDSIYGGGYYAANDTVASTVVTINAAAAVTSLLSGEARNGTYTAAVDSTLNLNFHGALAATIKNFDTLHLGSGSQVVFATRQDLGGVNHWKFDLSNPADDTPALLEWQSGSNNFALDTLELNLTQVPSGEGSWTLLQCGFDLSNGWAYEEGVSGFRSVMINNQISLAWNDVDAYMADDQAWKLSLDASNTNLILAKIA